MNKIHSMKYKKHRSGTWTALVLSLVLAAGYLIFPNLGVQAASLSVKASASTVKIGDSVTISITVPAGVSATVNLTYPSNLFAFSSASETANANGGTVSMTLGGYGGTDTATTGTVKFKAKAAGNATFSASAPVAGNQEGDQVSLGGASVSVKVKNEANDGGSSDNNNNNGNNGNNNNGGNNSGGNTNNNPDEGNERKSADNSLASLTLSAGTLTPSFKYSVVNYTATVDYSVTSVVVSAKVSNAKATIESVKGGDNLKVGKNTIQIVVKAENGVTATYTVTVTRNAQGESVPQPDEPGEEPPEEPDDSAQGYVIGGVRRYPSEAPLEESLEGFVAAEMTLWDKNYPCLVDAFAGGQMYLLKMTDENGADGRWYLIMGNNPYEAFDYVCLKSETGFVIVLPDGDGNAPDGYSMGTYELSGKGRIDAWFGDDEQPFALIYGVNQAGTKGWYQLDTEELTYMRYVASVERAPAVDTQEPSTEDSLVPAETDSDALAGLRKQNVLILGISAIIIIFLMCVILLLAICIKRGGGNDGGDDDLEFIDL